MSRPARTLAVAVALPILLGGCRPALDDRPWLITTARILGWRAEPPEAIPGTTVALRIVALDPAGAPDTTATAWTLCRLPKPLAEDRVVVPGCLAPAAADATGDPVSLAIPTDACRIFGPDTPQPAPGDPPSRPRDPDATGGYFQPLTIALGASLAVGLERVTCDLPDASLADARAFQAAYHPNQNPTLAALTLSAGGAAVDAGAVPAGARITVGATWLAGAAEPFPVFDRASRTVVERQETLRASWYATGGELAQPAVEITDATVLATSTEWTAPAAPATLEIVVVLRDSRGGSDAARVALRVIAAAGP